jgi:glucose/arabinose dehydrogenase
MRSRRVGVLILLAVAAAMAGCGGGGSASPSSSGPGTTSASPGASVSAGGTVPETPTPSASEPTSATPLADVRVTLTPVASMDAPLGMAFRTGDDALYVAEKGGRVLAIRSGAVDGSPVLDITGQVSEGSEQGLLGLTFSPDGAFLYVNYTDRDGDTVIEEYTMEWPRADASSARQVLTIDQPYANHNGGNVAFGPDGHLYIGMGDGGSQGDPENRSQNLQQLLGKMLRIDPRPAGGKPYGIPQDNPFVGRADARPEIWAYGLRNPWRWSFDRETGDLWIGDVGGGEREEIDFQPASSKGGEDYGWNLIEGTVPHSENLPVGLVPPVLDYSHAGGNCVVTGGSVYRGSAIPDLVGAYLYADFCVGDVKAIRVENGKVVDQTNLGVNASAIASFGEDQDGELYVISLGGQVYRIDPA